MSTRKTKGAVATGRAKYASASEIERGATSDALTTGPALMVTVRRRP